MRTPSTRIIAALMTAAIILSLALNAGSPSCPGAAPASMGAPKATLPSARGGGGQFGNGPQSHDVERGQGSDNAPARADLETLIGILDGDSALAALPIAASRSADRELAGEALARAGFIAYVKGDFAQAEALFAAAAGKGFPEALVWQGLALLAGGQIDGAARALRRAEDTARDPAAVAAASLGLAACDLASGRAHEAAGRCNDILERDAEGSAAAALLLHRCLLEGREGAGSFLSIENLAQRYPMAYETAAVRSAQELAGSGAEPAGRPETEEELMEGESGEVDRPSTVQDGSAATEGPAAQEAFSPQDGMPAGGGLAVERGSSVPDERAPGVGPTVQESFTVQVGAFSEVHNAEALAARLAEQGYDAARVESEMKKGALFHCVRVGRFGRRADAAALASILEEKEDLGTQIVKTVTDSTASAD